VFRPNLLLSRYIRYIGQSVAELGRKSISWKTSRSNGQMPVAIYYTVGPIWTDPFELLEQI